MAKYLLEYAVNASPCTWSHSCDSKKLKTRSRQPLRRGAAWPTATLYCERLQRRLVRLQTCRRSPHSCILGGLPMRGGVMPAVSPVKNALRMHGLVYDAPAAMESPEMQSSASTRALRTGICFTPRCQRQHSSLKKSQSDLQHLSLRRRIAIASVFITSSTIRH